MFFAMVGPTPARSRRHSTARSECRKRILRGFVGRSPRALRYLERNNESRRLPRVRRSGLHRWQRARHRRRDEHSVRRPVSAHSRARRGGRGALREGGAAPPTAIEEASLSPARRAFESRYLEGMTRARCWLELIAVVAVVLYAGPAMAADGDTYWRKPLSSLLLDAFMYASPVTAIACVLAAANPRWRKRPKDWRESNLVSSFGYRWLSQHVIRLAALASISLVGVVTLCLHLLDVV